MKKRSNLFILVIFNVSLLSVKGKKVYEAKEVVVKSGIAPLFLIHNSSLH